MSTVRGTRGMVRWGSGADSAATNQVIKTRNWEVTMTADVKEDTGHGDTVKSKALMFLDFGVKVTCLFDSSATAGAAKTIVTDAIAQNSGRFYLYPDSTVTSNYWSGRGWVAIDSHTAPYDDFSMFNMSFIANSGVTGTPAAGYQG